MNKKVKKIIMAFIASLLLFTAVGSPVVGVVQASDTKNIQKNLNNLSEIPTELSKEDIQFLSSMEKEMLAQVEKNPLLEPRAFNIRTLARNLQGLAIRSRGMSDALLKVGLGPAQIAALARGSWVYSYSVLGAKIATVATWNLWLGAVIGVTAGVAIYTMGHFRLFY